MLGVFAVDMKSHIEQIRCAIWCKWTEHRERASDGKDEGEQERGRTR